jgi:hypothetical protein
LIQFQFIIPFHHPYGSIAEPAFFMEFKQQFPLKQAPVPAATASGGEMK